MPGQRLENQSAILDAMGVSGRWACGAALVITVVLLACGTPTTPTAQPAGTTVARSTLAAAGEDVDGWLADLGAIDPRIVGRHSRALMLGRGHNVCSDLERGIEPARLLANVNARFTSPEADQGFGLDVARRILAVTHARLCPALPFPSL
jgi:hypothetical protein